MAAISVETNTEGALIKRTLVNIINLIERVKMKFSNCLCFIELSNLKPSSVEAKSIKAQTKPDFVIPDT